MKCFVVLSALLAVALAKPGYLGAHIASPLAYSTPLAYSAPVAYVKYAHGAPVGVDGRVVDTPEVAHAKAEHAAAHINEKVTLANEAAKSYAADAYVAPALVSSYAAPSFAAYGAPALSYSKVYAGSPVVSAYSAYAPALAYSHGAPLSIDGRVVDTPEVAHAKAAHFAAHAEAKARLGYGAHYAYAAPAVSVW